MIKPDRELGERAYDEFHVEIVLSEIKKNFPKYFKLFSEGEQEQADETFENSNFVVKTSSKKKKSAKAIIDASFLQAIEEFEEELPIYQDFLDVDGIDEYEDDPNTFKKDLSKKVPIINRCLNSSAREMKRYKSEYFKKSGRELLDVTYNIILFGSEYMETFDEKKHELSKTVEDLGLSELLEEEYIAYQVIGGGIKSHFLYSLYPNAFSNRSQSALWALWYLTNKNDFGFKDGSEFLMIDVDKGSTQQNYHYPYDLFCFYALNVYLLLKEACNREGIILQNKYRYIYLDNFLNYISNIEDDEISDLKKTGEYEE